MEGKPFQCAERLPSFAPLLLRYSRCLPEYSGNEINPNIGTGSFNEHGNIGRLTFAFNPGPNPVTIEATAECAKLVNVP